MANVNKSKKSNMLHKVCVTQVYKTTRKIVMRVAHERNGR
jgi:hypothetical protein